MTDNTQCLLLLLLLIREPDNGGVRNQGTPSMCTLFSLHEESPDSQVCRECANVCLVAESVIKMSMCN